MDEYIELEKVLDDSNIITVQTKEYGSVEVIPVDTITDIELADVQPVKHGKWKHVAGMNSKCFVCSHYFPVTEFDSRPFDINYCPN